MFYGFIMMNDEHYLKSKFGKCITYSIVALSFFFSTIGPSGWK
jgi:hypothetical protein